MTPDFDPSWEWPALYRLYEEDQALAAELGLEQYPRLKHGEWVEIGTWEHRQEDDGEDRLWATVKVEVIAWPAHFWRFTITSGIEDVQSMEISTGSGTLVDFWPTVRMAAVGLLHVEPATVTEA